MGTRRSAVAEKAPKEARWTARKKADAVVRLLRGESLDELSRELRVEAHRLQAWRDEFLAGGIEGLKARAASAGGPAAQGGRTQGRRAHHGQRDSAGGGPKKGGFRSRPGSGRDSRAARQSAQASVRRLGRPALDDLRARRCGDTRQQRCRDRVPKAGSQDRYPR